MDIMTKYEARLVVACDARNIRSTTVFGWEIPMVTVFGWEIPMVTVFGWEIPMGTVFGWDIPMVTVFGWDIPMVTNEEVVMHAYSKLQLDCYRNMYVARVIQFHAKNNNFGISANYACSSSVNFMEAALFQHYLRNHKLFFCYKQFVLVTKAEFLV
jgi:hypothetical protein